MGYSFNRKVRVRAMMRSFGFQKTMEMDDFEYLFRDFKKYNGEFDYSIELIDAMMDSRIDKTKEFSLFGYCKCIRDGKFQNDLKRLKKEQYIIEDDDDESSGIKASSLVEERDDYEVFEDTEEAMYTVKKIRALNLEFISELGIDLIHCLRQAVKGIPDAIETLTEFCNEYSKYSEYVQIILGCGIPFEELFPEEVLVFSSTKSVSAIDSVKVG